MISDIDVLQMRDDTANDIFDDDDDMLMVGKVCVRGVLVS